MADKKFADILEEEFRWPKAGDKLFLPGQPGQGAYLARHRGERIYRLTSGYKLAADLLVEHASTETWRKDVLIFPIVFCYRHYLELILKSLLDDYGPMGGVPANWSQHKLDELWSDFRILLRNIGSGHSDEDGTDAVEQCVAEFAKLDPISQTFRYPANRKGQPFDFGHETVDLLELRNTMLAIENYFMGCDGYLEESQNAQPAHWDC